MIATIVTLLGGWRAAVFAGIAVVAFGMVGTQTFRLHSAQTALATVKAEKATLETTMAKAAEAAEAKARAIEQSQAEAFTNAADAYQRGKTDAQAVRDTVAAGLHAGTVQLRRELAGCQAGSVPEAPASPGGTDVAASLRAGAQDAVAGAVSVGASCDARVTALQAILRAERQ